MSDRLAMVWRVGGARGPIRATSAQMGLLVAATIAISLIALVWAAGRTRELCVLSVRRGRVLVMRGALPPGLEEALADVVERARTRRATIRILRDGERARLIASGLDPFALQRARNVLGTYPLPRLLSARPARRRNLGQRLGLAWLGWWMRERS